jgi:protocatechuate 3,4-dioxygenase beta subunit
MRWFPLILLLGASLAAAQNTPSTPPTSSNGATPASEQKKIRVEGTILSLNGEAVRKATVRLMGTVLQPGQLPGNYSESTDNEGKFVFEDVAAGRYMLSAEKAGFVTTRYGARSNTSPGTQLNLSPGMELKGLAVKMTPQGVIAGKVLDQDGDPVASALVQVLRFAYLRGRRQAQPTGGGNTNDLGEFRISNLAPGRYYISASDGRATLITPDRTARPGRGQEANITTFYPNGTDASSAAPVDVAAGGEMRGIDIRLLRAKVYMVRGKTVDASGGASQAMVAFVRKEDGVTTPSFANRGGFTSLRPDGTFEFRNIVPGTYVLQALPGPTNLNGNIPGNLTGRLEVTVADANIEGLVLPLVAGPEITGTVKLEDGDIATLLKPAQNAPGVTAVGNVVLALPGRFVLTLTETEGVSVGSPNAQIKDDGTFKFNAVGTSKYVLNAISLPSGTYLKSARFGGQDVTHVPIDTTSGAGGTLDIVLSSKAADVAGSVQNDKGEALAGVMVTLWPKAPDASMTGGVRPGFTDQNGGFKFQGLAPGDYYVAAWEELEPGLATSADFLSHFTSEASAIKLAEGGHESRDVKPVPSDKILIEIAKLP